MKKIYTGVVKHRKLVMLLFTICAAVCLFLRGFVSVNYDIADYLPENAKSTVSLAVMQDEFDGGIPNARVMIRNVTIPEALEYKEKIKKVPGVINVAWLDDAVDITTPMAMLDEDAVGNYYKNNTALFSVTIKQEYRIDAVASIREIIGSDNAMTGNAVSTAVATTNTVAEVRKITVASVLFVLFVLFLTTLSWVEPIIILLGLGVAIALSSGSNLLFGEISFVTNAAGSILQLAVSLDYSVFLIHRFEECRQETDDVSEAMVNALCRGTMSILSSGLTTVIGFLALVLMRFRLGPDLGLALAKGVAISLITVFLFMPALILTTYKWLDKARHRNFMPAFKGFGNFVIAISMPMICIFAILIVPSYLASNANSYYYGSSQIYGEGTAYGRDKMAVESVFGKKDTYVLLVPKGSSATEIELSKELKTLPHVTEILSYVDTVGAEIPNEYLDAGTLSLLVSENYSRFVISVDADYEGVKTFKLVEQIRETADKYYPGKTYLAGEGVSASDLMDTITDDMKKVNLLAIGAVFLVLLIAMKSIMVPVILVLCIETAIWLNLSVPYFSDEPVYYIAYLIISSVQLGATVDYAILLSGRYRENRAAFGKKGAIVQTISDVTVSILTSGSAMTIVGLMLGYVSTNRLLAQLGVFIGRGALFSMSIVLLVLPRLLLLLDKRITTGGNLKLKNHKKRIVSSFLAILLMINAFFPQTFPATAYAKEQNTPKEEVVYINLNADGSVKEINIVNIFDLDEKGKIVDYGKYENLRNMTTTDAINYQNGMVTIDAGAGKLYYEGKLKSNAMPWSISIKYFIGGKEYSADEMSGMSGKLKIKMAIQKNEKCTSPFFEGYALQAAFILDTKKASNITAEGATIANAGSDKQITYTILPGKGADIEITADVTDFEMEGVSINGIPLNLNIEVDDAKLMERITALQEAVGELDDGTGKVYDGVAELKSGMQSDLKDGVSELKDGASKLQDGVSQLQDGGSNLQSGAADLQSGASSLNDGIISLNDGIARIQNALNSLNDKSGTLRNGSSEFRAALAKLKSALDDVSFSSEDLAKLTDASAAIKGSIERLTEGIGTLQQKAGFDAYKAAMEEKGLNIDKLKENNATALDGLNSAIDNLGSEVLSAFKAIDENADTSALEQQLGRFKEQNAAALSQLLQANNDAIDGTKGYLDNVSGGLSQLLSGAKELQSNYDAFNSEIVKLADALGSLAYKMSSLSTAVNSLVSAYKKIDSGIADYTDAVAQIVSGYSQVSSGAAKLVAGSSSLMSGTQSLYDGTGELVSGIEEVYNGTGTLYDGTGEMDKGVAELLDGIAKLYDGTGELKDGTSTFRKEADGMDAEINDKIDELLESITGGDIETLSFASADNANIESVQFVIKTPAIKNAKKDDPYEEAPATLNFRQKLLKLFNMYKEE